jgi:hypothetical protein
MNTGDSLGRPGAAIYNNLHTGGPTGGGFELFKGKQGRLHNIETEAF